MSWLFSRALVEAFSGGGCSAGEPSAPLSGSPTPQAYLPPDRMTAFFRPSRFGMTFAPLTDTLGAGLLTWFLAASRARTSAWPAKAPALTEPDPACGPTWRVSLARFDPATSSWRTAQRSLLEDSLESLVIWPRSGMTAGGQCWELPMSEHRISATGSGLWPTPVATDHLLMKGSETLEAWERRSAQKKQQGINLQFALRHAVQKWPTPTVCGNYNRKGLSDRSGDGLATAVSRCATPTARDWKSGKASDATMERNSRPLSEQIGGSLNPTWVEWLMGWPLGWTDLKPLATDRCLFAQPERGDCFQAA